MALKHQQLVHALALAKYGNFRQAAEDQHLSQPAFSRSIHNLEQSLGVTLFDRTAQGTSLTLYGEAMLKRAQKIVAEAGELKRELQLLQGLSLGKFTLAMALFPAELSASHALGELVQEYPELDCRAKLSNWEGVASEVLSRSVDLGMGEISVVEPDDRLQVELVGDHDVVLFVRKGHPLCGRKKVSASDIDIYNLALLKLPERLATMFPGKGRIDPYNGIKTPSIEVDDLMTARIIVMQSDAVSAATPVQIEPWLKSGELEVLPYHKPWLKTHYGFITRKDRLLSPAAKVFMNNVRRIELKLASRNRELMQKIFPD